ncbi:hypothetical protein BBI17_007283, partial [Phytophthora kernoviae]
MYMRSDFAALRVRKDVNELSKAKFTCSQAKTRVDFPDGAENMLKINFAISIADVSGPFANGDFTFFVEIPKTSYCPVSYELIFLEPGIDYVQNSVAAQQLHENPAQFKREVQQILCGGKYYGVDFPPHPRQLEKRRQSWGLRVKRARDDDSISDYGWSSGSTSSSNSSVCMTQGSADSSALMDFNGVS